VDEDLVTDKKAKTIMAMRSSGDLMGRPYVTAPGTPPEVMAILQDAFVKVSKDSELIADAKKMKLEIDYQSPDKIMKVLDDLFSQPQEMIDEYGKYVKF
jgi:tripartite-type tricarboxylate transporter receptor subunit TctC